MEWKPAKILFNPELEALQLMSDYHRRQIEHFAFGTRVKHVIQVNSIKAAWEVERYLEGIYARELFFSKTNRSRND